MSGSRLLPPPLRRAHPLDSLARRAALALLEHLEDGELTIVEPGGTHRFGDGDGGLRATVRINAAHAYAAGLTGSAGLARAYLDRLWECDDLVALVRILSRNLDGVDRLRERIAPLWRPLLDAGHLVARNTPGRNRRQVEAHYDLGNDLFASMLDETMAYSCGVFPHPGASLAEASVTKMEMACRKLRLGPADHLVEIGTGWGGFALHAATRHGCRVTTTTISHEQFEFATERVARAGLSGRITVINADYRELRGRYDKLASIEMIEAVGWQHFDDFFGACARLLESDGAMFLQAIVTSHPLYRQWRSARGLANSLIFPGGCLPSVEAMLLSVARVSDMRLIDLEDITAHYVPTLRGWRERFLANRHSLDGGRYGERFQRLWELYLAYCEGAFAERRIRDVQMLLVRAGFRAELRAVGAAA